ncbi:MAG: Transposase [Syntrophorhabdus sp. PtaU1.Bin002]|nr:MAG: Transposase [Syntrophorhabdus sp. PtaB.Bin006]OPY66167.1 MAG: Transposase [Syntrophorhabdus sp. PtaU1.Bin002]
MTSQGRRKFDREFKIETVKLVIERGMSVAQVSRDLGIHGNVLRKWKNRVQGEEDVSRAQHIEERLLWVEETNTRRQDTRE